jgi:hypothetical protein
MASFKSILGDVGHGLAKFFDVATTVAADAEPFVDIIFPGVAPLYNSTVSAVVAAEAAATAAGKQNGTGPQKLAMVVAAIEGQFNAYAKANNLTTPTVTTVETYVNAVVASLNAIPATVPASTTSTTTATS